MNDVTHSVLPLLLLLPQLFLPSALFRQTSLAAVKMIAYDLVFSEWMDGTMRKSAFPMRRWKVFPRSANINCVQFVGYGILCDRMIFRYITNVNVCAYCVEKGVWDWVGVDACVAANNIINVIMLLLWWLCRATHTCRWTILAPRTNRQWQRTTV